MPPLVENFFDFLVCLMGPVDDLYFRSYYPLYSALHRGKMGTGKADRCAFADAGR